MGAVLGRQVFLALLLVLGAAPIEVDLVLVALRGLPPGVCVLDRLGLLDGLDRQHGLSVIGRRLFRLPHLHLDQGAFLEKKEEIESQSF